MREAINFENFKKPEENLQPEENLEIASSAVEAEADNLKGAVIQALGKREAFKLAKAKDVEEGKTSLGLHKQKFLNMGEIAEKEAKRRGEDFDSTDYLLTRADLIADELINSAE